MDAWTPYLIIELPGLLWSVAGAAELVPVGTVPVQKASRICDSCLPGRIGNCTNILLANPDTAPMSATTITADVNFTITNEEVVTGASSSSPKTQTFPVPSHSPLDSVRN